VIEGWSTGYAFTGVQKGKLGFPWHIDRNQWSHSLKLFFCDHCDQCQGLNPRSLDPMLLPFLFLVWAQRSSGPPTRLRKEKKSRGDQEMIRDDVLIHYEERNSSWGAALHPGSYGRSTRIDPSFNVGQQWLSRASESEGSVFRPAHTRMKAMLRSHIKRRTDHNSFIIYLDLPSIIFISLNHRLTLFLSFIESQSNGGSNRKWK